MPPDARAEHVPLEAKAIAIGHWHLQALARRDAVVREFRAFGEVPRALEGFWIVVEAALAQFEGRIITQKDLAARATGTISPATISRAVRDVETEGWIITYPSPKDARVRVIELTPRARAHYLARAEAAWDAFWSIAETALNAAREPTAADRDS